MTALMHQAIWLRRPRMLHSSRSEVAFEGAYHCSNRVSMLQGASNGSRLLRRLTCRALALLPVCTDKALRNVHLGLKAHPLLQLVRLEGG